MENETFKCVGCDETYVLGRDDCYPMGDECLCSRCFSKYGMECQMTGEYFCIDYGCPRDDKDESCGNCPFIGN